MDLLLDTHALIFALAAPDPLSGDASAAIRDPGRVVWYSAANVWEIEIKAALGKLDRPASDVAAAARRLGLTELPITAEHAAVAGRLPPHHRDPFDRILVAQAVVEGLVLVTADGALSAYDVPILRA